MNGFRASIHRRALRCGDSGTEETHDWLFCDERPRRFVGLPSEVFPACGVCRRTVLVGERVARFRIDDRFIEACPLCEPHLLDLGFARAA
ncbi:MAG TPA: hypothetical protein VMH50_16800 [Thermoleophilia bacterium]|nr:hypothetical protein [Thermoleophilia bacterium]